MKPMTELAVTACQESLIYLATAIRAEAGEKNFDAVRQLAEIGSNLHNLAHNGDMSGTLTDVPPPRLRESL